MRWNYLEIGITRKEAEEKILSIGFTPDKTKGWELPIKKGGRFHIVACDNEFSIHRDNKAHHCVTDQKTKRYLKRFISRLNTFSFKWKVKLLFRRIFLRVRIICW